jgi:hypothetical protein
VASHCGLPTEDAAVLRRTARVGARWTEARDLYLWVLANLSGAKDREVASAAGLTRLAIIKSRQRVYRRRQNSRHFHEISARLLRFVESDPEFCTEVRATIFASFEANQRHGAPKMPERHA